MENMDKRLLEILQHAIGVDENGQGVAYRNHFCAGEKDLIACRELVSQGLMEEHPASQLTGGSALFTVTRDGVEAISKHSPKPPKMTRSQKRYRAYLKVADCFGSFKEYLKTEQLVRGQGRRQVCTGC
jgi:hypothetical protein